LITNFLQNKKGDETEAELAMKAEQAVKDSLTLQLAIFSWRNQ